MNEKQFMALVGGGLIIYLIVKFFWPETSNRAQKGTYEGKEKLLEDEMPTEGTKLVKVFRSIYPIEAHFVKTLLQNANIPCTIFDEGVLTANPLYSFAVGGPKVMVPIERLEEAKSIIEEYIRTDQETFRQRIKDEEATED